jgi:hypothetical protein
MSQKLDVERCELACKLRMDENGTKHHIKHDFEDIVKVPRVSPRKQTNFLAIIFRL